MFSAISPRLSSFSQFLPIFFLEMSCHFLNFHLCSYDVSPYFLNISSNFPNVSSYFLIVFAHFPERLFSFFQRFSSILPDLSFTPHFSFIVCNVSANSFNTYPSFSQPVSINPRQLSSFFGHFSLLFLMSPSLNISRHSPNVFPYSYSFPYIFLHGYAAPFLFTIHIFSPSLFYSFLKAAFSVTMLSSFRNSIPYFSHHYHNLASCFI